MFNGKFISAIIVSAGSSSRMKSSISKQLMLLGEKTVIENTVEKFKKCELFDEIIVVCPTGDETLYKELLGKDVKIVGGGATRQQSVYNGVNISSDGCEIVVIHDGARTLIHITDIVKVIKDGVDYGASTLAVPVKDTVKIVRGGKVVDTPNRSELYAVQTPQVFYKRKYMQAYVNAQSMNLEFTDDCQLIESIGGVIHITEGRYSNIKITTPEDIYIAEELLKRGDDI